MAIYKKHKDIKTASLVTASSIDETTLNKLKNVVKEVLNAEVDLGQTCEPGVVAAAPRLLDCAVQIECVAGKLVDASFDVELCGDVVRVHREKVVIDPVDIPDLCAIYPLSPARDS